MKLDFLQTLTLVFVIAKIGEFVEWSWWLVFTPIFVSIFLHTLASFNEKRKEK